MKRRETEEEKGRNERGKKKLPEQIAEYQPRDFPRKSRDARFDARKRAPDGFRESETRAYRDPSISLQKSAHTINKMAARPSALGRGVQGEDGRESRASPATFLAIFPRRRDEFHVHFSSEIDDHEIVRLSGTRPVTCSSIAITRNTTHLIYFRLKRQRRLSHELLRSRTNLSLKLDVNV